MVASRKADGLKVCQIEYVVRPGDPDCVPALAQTQTEHYPPSFPVTFTLITNHKTARKTNQISRREASRPIRRLTKKSRRQGDGKRGDAVTTAILGN